MRRAGNLWIAGPLAAAGLLVLTAQEAGATAAEEPATHDLRLSSQQMLAVAAEAAAQGDLTAAEPLYRALFNDPSRDIRSEARFRLALLLAVHKRLAEAATLLRAVLDEQHGAQRVRLELARLLDQMGDEAGARRALREAQAGGLPPEVARMVDRYSAALRAQKPLGASIDVALAPDSNINRSTRSQTLGTVLGDFVLDANAKQQSGIGLALRAQAYLHVRVLPGASLFARVSGSADLYRSGQFNDVALAAALGPEFRSGADRISLEAGGLWRWFGGRPYSQGATVTVNFSHPLGRKAQLRASAGLSTIHNSINPLLNGHAWFASLSYERALSSRAGLGVVFNAERQAVMDAAYSTWNGQVSIFGYRDLGPVNLVATLALGRLEADERIALFGERRSDRLYRVSLAATFRNLRIKTFAPFVRITWERNKSATVIYDYGKVRTELGISRAF